MAGRGVRTGQAAFQGNGTGGFPAPGDKWGRSNFSGPGGGGLEHYCTSLTIMETAKLFTSGRSQAVRLPKEYRMPGKEVFVKHFGKGVLLLPQEDAWQLMEEALAEFEPGFHINRQQPPQQARGDWPE